MKLGRFGAPLAIVRDSYLFALGGMIGKGKSANTAEVYDIKANQWYHIPSMNKERSCTSACVMNQ